VAARQPPEEGRSGDVGAKCCWDAHAVPQCAAVESAGDEAGYPKCCRAASSTIKIPPKEPKIL